MIIGKGFAALWMFTVAALFFLSFFPHAVSLVLFIALLELRSSSCSSWELVHATILVYIWYSSSCIWNGFHHLGSCMVTSEACIVWRCVQTWCAQLGGPWGIDSHDSTGDVVNADWCPPLDRIHCWHPARLVWRWWSPFLLTFSLLLSSSFVLIMSGYYGRFSIWSNVSGRLFIGSSCRVVDYL